MTTEDLLAVALIAVYLWDSMYFLSIGEAVVETLGNSPRRLRFGASFELAGRRPFLPNPLTPFRPAFRLQWDTSGAPIADVHTAGDEMKATLQAIRPLRWITCANGLLILIAAPVCLVLGEQIGFLASVAAALLVALAGCTIVVLRRKQLGLQATQVLALVFVALVCLPCAPNLARAIATQRKWTLAARDLPQLGFEGSASTDAQRRTLEVLSSAKRYVADDSEQYKVIAEQIRLLEGSIT